MDEQLPCILREAEPTDLAFCIDPWLKEASRGPMALMVPPSVFSEHFRRLILRVMQNGRTLVACEPADINHTYGFIVSGPNYMGLPVVHWVYVKSTYWGMGIGTQLFRSVVSSGQSWCSMLSLLCQVPKNIKIMRDLRVIYNPFILMPMAHSGENR